MDPTVDRGSYEFERLLDSEEAAALLHVHPESLKRLARRGKVVAAKMGGIWRFRASSLEAYMGEITANTQARIAQAMAPSDPAVCAVRNRRN